MENPIIQVTEYDFYKKMASMTDEYFECQLPVLNESEKAICFDSSSSDLTTKGVWIPKSQMVIVDLRPDLGIRYFIKIDYILK